MWFRLVRKYDFNPLYDPSSFVFSRRSVGHPTFEMGRFELFSHSASLAGGPNVSACSQLSWQLPGRCIFISQLGTALLFTLFPCLEFLAQEPSCLLCAHMLVLLFAIRFAQGKPSQAPNQFTNQPNNHQTDSRTSECIRFGNNGAKIAKKLYRNVY